ncbi:hypothetical protein Nepgr_031397 [Nepenthes gracilis]|uniref:Uncharacterized protein n=1 Tax=Nepenthes gracilis TaxID=150966 RepID=A0AAD3TI71_NEPGR|nr:hypothetical protein Nepgr_031397 [Nepenthes gracilis]
MILRRSNYTPDLADLAHPFVLTVTWQNLAPYRLWARIQTIISDGPPLRSCDIPPMRISHSRSTPPDVSGFEGLLTCATGYYRSGKFSARYIKPSYGVPSLPLVRFFCSCFRQSLSLFTSPVKKKKQANKSLQEQGVV